MAKTIAATEKESLLKLLQKRFNVHAKHFEGISWTRIEQQLNAYPNTLWTLNAMEKTGGEPSLLKVDLKNNLFYFCDFSTESPNRRSLCYDQAALEARKKFKPENAAVTVATAMGVSLLDETEYRLLQTFGPCDTKTSSWLKTPAAIRTLGGALFGDFRYNTVFIYHNGADSYYAARGFRGIISI